VGDESDSGAQLTVSGVGNLPHVFYSYFSSHFFVATLLPDEMAFW
jgi:hypothetical protein